MKCLSVRQPWAGLLVHGYKDIENRTWSTRHRGPLLIHAGRKFDIEGLLWVMRMFPEIDVPNVVSFARGAIIGQVNVLDVFHGFESCLLESPWWDRENWGWKIGGAVVFETPLPYRGQLRLFDVELVDALRALRKCINGPLMPCVQKPHER